VPYKNSDPIQEFFLEDLLLYIIKSYQPLNSTKNVWLKRLVFHQCGRVTFLSKQQLSDKVIMSMVSKTMECHVLLVLLMPLQLQPHLICGCPEEVLISLF